MLCSEIGVNRAAKVLVQMFPDNLHTHLLQSDIPIVYEFDLRGAHIGADW
jgi:hypothetical protein